MSLNLLSEMDERLERIETGVDLRVFLEDYLAKLSRYHELEKRNVDDYLFILAGFVDSPAAQRMVDGEPVWRTVARILIYSLDRE